MPEERPSPVVERLSLTREEQWTLHDVLRDHLSDEDGDERGEVADVIDCRAAFETLDAGSQQFTRTQLEAVQRALARAHHTRRWEMERPLLEALLHRVSNVLEERNGPAQTESTG